MCLNKIKLGKTKIGEIMHIEILLKEIRKDRNLTLEQLSEKSGISRSHINDVENGNKEPGLSIMVRLAKVLDVAITDLYKVVW